VTSPSTVCPVTRTAVRSALVGATVALVLLPAPVLADVDDGSEGGGGLSVLETLFWFVGVPLGLFLLIALLVSAPSMARGPRYRPGLGWWSAPVWFNGPDSPDSAVRNAAPTTGSGGASARW
jgi:hypothetical protein